MRIATIPYFACVALLIQPARADDAANPQTIRFNEHIRPILSDHCFACHGPDSGSRKANLRLDVQSSAIDSGAVVPGDVASSELIARITSNDSDVMMPPPEFRKRLKPEHRQRLARWIEAGAEWEEHWAFIRPIRPQMPAVDGVDDWASNAIDHFTFNGMRNLGLDPNPPADRYRLARRAALDVTGLPPTRDMLDEFLADSRDNAWSRYIDRLLASKHAGEHRARYWLDAARYGDTHGMHVDNYREIWPYRDWVVNAFNTNMPFDRFVVEQIAGDLLPSPTLGQRIATGFNRCNITTSEGGAIPAELDVRYMVDRVETTATVFLGLTAGCAVCHDHKYDPLSQREFYQLGAFFNNSTTPAMDGNQKDTPPVVTLPKEEFKDEWAALRTRRAELSARLDERSSSVADWWSSHPVSVAHPVSDDGLVLSLPLTEDAADTVPLPKSAEWVTDHPGGRRGIRFGDGGGFTADLPKLRTDGPLSVSFWVRTPDRLLATTLFDHTTQTKDKKTVGWKITSSTQGALTFQMWDANGKNIRGLLPGEEALTPRSWQHVCVRYSGGQSNSSINILVDGQQKVLRNSTETLIDGTDLADTPLKVASRLPTAGLSDIRIFRRWITDDEADVLARDVRLREALATKSAWNDLAEPQRELLRQYYDVAANEPSRTALHEYAQSQRRRDFIYSRSTTTLVMQERSTVPRAWVLERGEYDQRREEVAPAVPAVLRISAIEPKSRPSSRLDLARWLVHPDHPLTARVMVNRLWQSVFGTGLVKTSEDFGVMGERPSNPELLDWLAVEFVESGWNVNHLLRLMLTSSTYRQSSTVTDDRLLKDRDNRFLTRGPRLRLDAEVLRDQALAVSGLLRREMGGPTVKPYQPAGLWKVVAITGSNTRIFQKDTGDKLYRRSLYTFWKRTSPPPSMAAFNAPTREQCTVRRERTNTPLQALVLMNDPQYVEAARHLAQNAIHQSSDERWRARWMLTTALSRPANDSDVSDMLAVADELRAIFKQEPDAAKELINTGDSPPDEKLDTIELAAWTMVSNTIMNRDDFVNK